MNETTVNEDMADRVRLITNLNCATIVRGGSPVRTVISAILLEDRERFFPGQPGGQLVRGLGPDLAWPGFSVELGCGRLEYKRASYQSPDEFEFHDGVWKRRSGAIFRWADGTTIEVLVQDANRPLDIVDVTAGQLGDVLSVKVASYWVDPYMPTLCWTPTDEVRRHFGAPNPNA